MTQRDYLDEAKVTLSYLNKTRTRLSQSYDFIPVSVDILIPIILVIIKFLVGKRSCFENFS